MHIFFCRIKNMCRRIHGVQFYIWMRAKPFLEIFILDFFLGYDNNICVQFFYCAIQYFDKHTFDAADYDFWDTKCNFHTHFIPHIQKFPVLIRVSP